MNPLIVGAFIALGKGATIREVKEDSVGYAISYPGADDFTDAWDTAHTDERFQLWLEEFNDTINAATAALGIEVE